MYIIKEVKARNHFYKKELDFVITKLRQKRKIDFQIIKNILLFGKSLESKVSHEVFISLLVTCRVKSNDGGDSGCESKERKEVVSLHGGDYGGRELCY